ANLAPARKIVVARELTKQFEEVVSGSAAQLLACWTEKEPRGELAILIAPPAEETLQIWAELTLREHVTRLQSEYQLSQQEAIKLAAKLRQLPKREVYREFHS